MLHLMFSNMMAETLREALSQVGRSDDILVLNEDFSMGPIASECIASRDQWVDNVLMCDKAADWQNRDYFLATSRSSTQPIMAWVDSTWTLCRAGFLWWHAHFDGVPFSLIERDSLAVYYAHEMAALIEQGQPVATERREKLREEWHLLQTEDAPLRVLEGGALISAQMDYFDSALLQHTRPEWQMAWHIVGRIFYDQAEAKISQVSDPFLFARIKALADQEILELKGDLGELRSWETRLAQ